MESRQTGAIVQHATRATRRANMFRRMAPVQLHRANLKHGTRTRRDCPKPGARALQCFIPPERVDSVRCNGFAAIKKPGTTTRTPQRGLNTQCQMAWKSAGDQRLECPAPIELRRCYSKVKATKAVRDESSRTHIKPRSPAFVIPSSS